MGKLGRRAARPSGCRSVSFEELLGGQSVTIFANGADAVELWDELPISRLIATEGIDITFAATFAKDTQFVLHGVNTAPPTGATGMEIRAGWVFSRPWVGVGDSSYSLYLWHYPLFAVLAACYADLGIIGKVPVEVLALTSCSIAVLIGLASYYAIERPINKSGWLARLAGVQSKAMRPCKMSRRQMTTKRR